jgi:hypothetical protein
MSCWDTFIGYNQKISHLSTVWSHLDLVQWSWMQQPKWCLWHGLALLIFTLLHQLNRLKVIRYSLRLIIFLSHRKKFTYTNFQCKVMRSDYKICVLSFMIKHPIFAIVLINASWYEMEEAVGLLNNLTKLLIKDILIYVVKPENIGYFCVLCI